MLTEDNTETQTCMSSGGGEITHGLAISEDIVRRTARVKNESLRLPPGLSFGPTIRFIESSSLHI